MVCHGRSSFTNNRREDYVTIWREEVEAKSGELAKAGTPAREDIQT